MPNLRGSEWLIIILIVALLFGAKRMPDAARSLGRSLRIFKAETKGLAGGDSSEGAPASSATPAVTATTAAAPVAPPPVAPPAPVPAATESAGPALQPQVDAVPPALQQPPTSQA